MISIIIVNYNGNEQTKNCLSSLFAHPPTEDFEVILVDNCSIDGSVQDIQKEFPSIKIIQMENNYGFGKANNAGVLASTGEYLFFVNNDTVLRNDIVTPLMRYLKNNTLIGAVAPMLLNADGTYQHSYGYFPSLINELRTKKDTAVNKELPNERLPKKVDWVSFAAVMIPRIAFERIGGFDERYFMYFEDADVCLRLKKAGFDSFYCAESSLIHIGGKSWSSSNTNKLKKEYRRSQLLFYLSHRTWYSFIALRFYLLMQYGLLFLLGKGETRKQARSILSIVIIPYANRS